MENVKVSCIIPVYNVERHLKRTLNSLQAQTFKEFELIVVNDCSQDQSINILCEYQKDDKRISIINMSENRGAAISRNEGLKKARGEYVIFLDADDFFYDKMLEDVYNTAINYRADLVVFGYERIIIKINENGEENELEKLISFYESNEYRKENVDINLLKKVDHVPWNKLVRRELLKKNNVTFQDIPTNNDVFFSLSVALLSSKTVILDKILLRHYSGWKNSLTQQRIHMQSNLVKAYSFFYFFVNQIDEPTISPEGILNYILDDITIYLGTEGIGEHVKEQECNQLLHDQVLLPAIVEGMEKKTLKRHNICFAHALLNHKRVINRNKYVYYLDAISLIVEEAHKENHKIALWGVGIRGKKLVDLFVQNDISVDFLVDMDKQKQGTVYRSYRVYDYTFVQNEVDIILVSNSEFMKSISEIADGKNIIDISDL